MEVVTLKIIEYEEKYLDDVKDLLVELEEYILSIDKDNLDQLHPEYRDKMAFVALDEVFKNNGKCYLALQNDKVVGLIMGIISKYGKYDYLDYKCPKRAEITEFIVSENSRSNGVGKLLIDKIEDYFKINNCEYVLVDVFAYNTSAINFYLAHDYHSRMIVNIKKL